MPPISVVVPVYNSAGALDELTQRLNTVLSTLCEMFEIIFVNDGSRDASWQVIQSLSKKYTQVSGISMLRNFGQHNALLAGIRRARHPIIVTCDDDLQHAPESIPSLIKLLSEGHDVVYGTPLNERHCAFRALASQMTKLALSEALGAQTAKKVSAFRAFRTHLRDAFSNYHSPQVCLDVLLTWGTDKFVSVSVPHHPRKYGDSNYTFYKLLRHGANMMTGFTVLPLQVASLAGFAFMFFGFAVLSYVMVRWFIQGSVVPGFAFLASEVAIFSGIQLFSLGIFGEYLARMHLRSMEKPVYVIAETTPESHSLARAS